MQKIYISTLILFASLLLSCAVSVNSPTIDATSAAFYAASNKHHRMAYGQVPAADQGWLSLIDEFQHIIDVETKGEWADDAQYAIASCWMWLGQHADLSPMERAIDAFQKLLQDYPDSPRAADSHYWLGHCYELLGDYNQAATHYQMVISRHSDRPIADEAQLQIGRSYQRQRHFASAMATYQALSDQSQNPRIAAQAKRQIAHLQSRQTVASKPTDLPHATAQRKPPQLEQPAKAGGKTKIAPPREKKPPSVSKPIPNPSLVQQLGLDVKTIVIDPGHGGKDPGAVSKSKQEKKIVLSISKALRELLVEKGYRVRLTRETDVYIPLEDRTQFATIGEADLFISIHINASANPNAVGIETYYLALASDESARITAARENVGTKYSIKALDKLVGEILKESKSTESRRLAEFMQEQLALATRASNRGVKHAPFVVLIGTKVPAVLIEVGFLSNSAEAQKLLTKAYQRQIAEGIAKGVEQYVTNILLATADANRQISQ